MKQPIRIATRQSALAMWQAKYVQQKLVAQFPELTIELLPMTTKGDQMLGLPLATIGGKGLFLKELEQALLDGRADLAVHSLKDVTVEQPAGLTLEAFCPRGEAKDALVSNRYATLTELPHGAVIGTSSLRRSCQLKAWRPDLQLKLLRGNVQTRLAKLDDDEFDAIILAAAGLERLMLTNRIREKISPEIMLPAVGQGIMVVQTRGQDRELSRYLRALHCEQTASCALAEREVNKQLQGGCQVPLAAHATLDGETLTLQGLVGSLCGKQILHAKASGPKKVPQGVGQVVADILKEQGALALIQAAYAAHQESSP